MMTKNLAQIWAEMLAALSASFEGRSWKIWLDAAHPRTLEENTLSLDVPNDFTKNTPVIVSAGAASGAASAALMR